MASSINAVLNIGAGALFANQTAIQTTGNNIANVNTEGYSRQRVRFEEYPSLDFAPGQMGQGVRAAEVYRMFDRFVEKAYLSKSSQATRWNEQHQLLTSVESLFNESNSPGIASALDEFFNGWQQLSQDGASSSNREALLSNAETLAAFISETDQAMAYMQKQMDGLIQTDIDRANTLMKEIAALNKQINTHSIPGSNNPNTLMDQRDLKVRELAGIVDIDVIDRGEGHYVVNTKSGMTLVDEEVSYSFEYWGARSEKYLTTNSAYTGDIRFDGSDEYEYTVKVIGYADGSGGVTSTGSGLVDTSGSVPPAAGTPIYQVSLDGGRTWLKNADGTVANYPATDTANQVTVKDLNISFDAGSPLSVGDRFEIVPKSAIYWNSPTTGLINVTPQMLGDGTANDRRLTGGTITSYFDFRDNQLAQYRERLDAFAQSLTWEVNRIHSQGVGLEKLSSVLGDYRVENIDVPLNSNQSGLVWAGRLQQGNFSIAIYDSATGDPVYSDPGVRTALDVNFDPATDTLESLRDKINGSSANANPSGVPPTFVTATIVDGRLQIQSNSANHQFGFEADTSGVLAAMGINTFFKGEHAGDMAVRDEIVHNLNLINAGRINGGAEGNRGDTITALEIAQLSTKKVSIGTATQGAMEQTLVGFYATLVAKVGGDTATAKYNSGLYGAMAQDLRDKQDENAGVNLDEEMTNLVRFQNSYKAAAKLITTADQMLQTILGLKQ